MEKKIKAVLLNIFGNIVLAFAIGEFLLPSKILTGGVAGIAILLKPFIPLEEDYIVTVLAVLFYILGAIFLGRKFAIHTAISTVVYPLCLILINRYVPRISCEPILASMYGGLLGGIGIGIVFRQGGSTGGTDVPPLIMNKYLGIDVDKAVGFVDALTVIAGIIIYGPEAVLVGLISVFATSYGIKIMMRYGTTRSKKIEVISKHADAIMDEIHGSIERGTTRLKAYGGYSKEERDMFVTIVGENQYQKVLDIINKHDSEAFVVVSDVNAVRGEGFSYEARI